MSPERPLIGPAGNKRQKIILGLIILVVIFIAWQIYGLFSNSVSTPSTSESTGAATPTPTAIMPKPASLKKAPLSPAEQSLMRLQEQTQARYLAAMNELQMLKLQLSIAETNKAIMAAKLDTLTSEKNIIDMLKPQPVTPAAYAQGLGNQLVGGGPMTTTPTTPKPPEKPAESTVTTEVTYTLISVSKLLDQWSAVLGYQGNLYHVSIGDILPPDGSHVTKIDRSGIVLEKDGTKRNISLVPII